MTGQPLSVDLFSDIVCPWCYIGERRFEEARAQVGSAIPVEVRYRPFQLDPAAPTEARPLNDYLQGRFGAAAERMKQNVSNAAASVGITIDWKRALAVNTRNAHRLMRLAREESHASQRALLEALFAAHFTHGVDISDPAELARMAEESGMDGNRTRAWLESDAGELELRQEIEEAQALGIQGVPAFVFASKYLVEGAQSADTFAQVLQRLHGAAT
jgi:predicted DsbA family dithiol-disulfide isomerase